MNATKNAINRLGFILGRLGYEAALRRGKDTENRVLWAFENALQPAPDWLRSIDRGSVEQDLYKGIDFVIETNDMSKIFLQVKSSHMLANKFRFKQSKRRYNRYIAVVVIDSTLTADVVCTRVISAVSEIRNKLLAMRQ